MIISVLNGPRVHANQKPLILSLKKDEENYASATKIKPSFLSPGNAGSPVVSNEIAMPYATSLCSQCQCHENSKKEEN